VLFARFGHIHRGPPATPPETPQLSRTYFVV
jgi:hypothetical protein